MFKKITNALNKSVWEPVKRNVTAVMFWGGLIMLIFGIFLHNGIGDFLLKGGSAILGAGVFAAIMKSSQFTDIFQKHIYDVFYAPSKIGNGIDVVGKWKILTGELLKKVLPTSYNEAVDKIEENFIANDLEYHFENHKVEYDISIDSDFIARVKSKTTTTIVLSKISDNPIMEQTLVGDENSEVTKLFLNGKEVDSRDCEFEPIEGNLTTKRLKVYLNKYKNNDHDNTIEMERVFSWTQKLDEDPIISGYISRYIKGLEVKIKISEGFKVKFGSFRGIDIPESDYYTDDGMGYEKWKLAGRGELLLPEQTYFYAIIKEKGVSE